jgi:chaperonin GroES
MLAKAATQANTYGAEQESRRRLEMKFKPLGNQVLLKSVEQEQRTASGIVLPETAKEKPQTAKVVAIGDSEDGRIREDDLVVFAKYSGTEIGLDGEDFLILDSGDLLGVVED